MIKLTNCTKKYGNRIILDNLSFEAISGRSYAIIGASGTGKSTLLNILGTLDNDFTGELCIDKIDIKNQGDESVSMIRNQYIGFVFQANHLLSNYTVLENLFIPLSYSNQERKNFSELIDGVLNDLGILEYLNTRINVLSGGEKQRVSIARAMINNPSILIADEPTGNLDFENTQKIMQLFTQIKNKNKAVIIVTHDYRVAEFCDEIYELNNKCISLLKK